MNKNKILVIGLLILASIMTPIIVKANCSGNKVAKNYKITVIDKSNSAVSNYRMTIVRKMGANQYFAKVKSLDIGNIGNTTVTKSGEQISFNLPVEFTLLSGTPQVKKEIMLYRCMGTIGFNCHSGGDCEGSIFSPEHNTVLNFEATYIAKPR